MITGNLKDKNNNPAYITINGTTADSTGNFTVAKTRTKLGSIENKFDLNTLKEDGSYFGSNFINGHIDTISTIEVRRFSDDYLAQIQTDITSENDFIRYFSNNIWSPWKKYANNEDIDLVYNGGIKSKLLIDNISAKGFIVEIKDVESLNNNQAGVLKFNIMDKSTGNVHTINFDVSINSSSGLVIENVDENITAKLYGIDASLTTNSDGTKDWSIFITKSTLNSDTVNEFICNCKWIYISGNSDNISVEKLDGDILNTEPNIFPLMESLGNGGIVGYIETDSNKNVLGDIYLRASDMVPCVLIKEYVATPEKPFLNEFSDEYFVEVSNDNLYKILLDVKSSMLLPSPVIDVTPVEISTGLDLADDTEYLVTDVIKSITINTVTGSGRINFTVDTLSNGEMFSVTLPSDSGWDNQNTPYFMSGRMYNIFYLDGTFYADNGR